MVEAAITKSCDFSNGHGKSWNYISRFLWEPWELSFSRNRSRSATPEAAAALRGKMLTDNPSTSSYLFSSEVNKYCSEYNTEDDGEQKNISSPW